MRLRVQRNSVNPPNWPDGLTLRIVALSDIHACEPWMSAERITYIVDQTNRLEPDLIVLLGDYAALRTDHEPAAVRTAYEKALNIARAHGAFTWEYYAALSLAEWHIANGEPAAGRGLLEPMHRRFSQGSTLAAYAAGEALLQGS